MRRVARGPRARADLLSATTLALSKFSFAASKSPSSSARSPVRKNSCARGSSGAVATTFGPPAKYGLAIKNTPMLTQPTSRAATTHPPTRRREPTPGTSTGSSAPSIALRIGSRSSYDGRELRDTGTVGIGKGDDISGRTDATFDTFETITPCTADIVAAIGDVVSARRLARRRGGGSPAAAAPPAPAA